jgi:hypothetical protein
LDRLTSIYRADWPPSPAGKDEVWSGCTVSVLREASRPLPTWADWPPAPSRTGQVWSGHRSSASRAGWPPSPRRTGRHPYGGLASIPTGDWPPSLRGTGLHLYGGLASIPTRDWPPSLRGTGLQGQLAEVRYGAGALADRAARDRERGGRGAGHHQAVAPALTLHTEAEFLNF